MNSLVLAPGIFNSFNGYSSSDRSSSLFQKPVSPKSIQGKNSLNVRSYSKDNQLSPRSKMMKFIPLIKTVQFLTSKIKKHQYFVWCRLESISKKEIQKEIKYRKAQKNQSKNIQGEFINDNILQASNGDNFGLALIEDKENLAVLLNSNQNNIISKNQQNNPMLNSTDFSLKNKAVNNMVQNFMSENKQINKKKQYFAAASNIFLLIQRKNLSLYTNCIKISFLKLKKYNNYHNGFHTIYKAKSQINIGAIKQALKNIKKYINFKIKAEILYNSLLHFETYKKRNIMKQLIQRLKQIKIQSQKSQSKLQINKSLSAKQNKTHTSSQEKQNMVQPYCQKIYIQPIVGLNLLQSQKNLQKLVKKAVNQYQTAKEIPRQRQQIQDFQVKTVRPLSIFLTTQKKQPSNIKLIKLDDTPIKRDNQIKSPHCKAMKKLLHLYAQTPLNQISDCSDSFSIFNVEVKNNLIFQTYIHKNKVQERPQIQNEEQISKRLMTQKIQEYHQAQSDRLNSHNLYIQQFKTVNSCNPIKSQRKKLSMIKLSNKSKNSMKIVSSQKKKDNNFKSTLSVEKYKIQMKKSTSCKSILAGRKSRQENHNKISININIPAQLQRSKQIITKDKERVCTTANHNQKSISRVEWKSDKKSKYALFSCQNKENNLSKGYSDQKTVRIGSKQLKNRQKNIPCSQFMVQPVQTKILKNNSNGQTVRNGTQYQNKSNSYEPMCLSSSIRQNSNRPSEGNIFNQLNLNYGNTTNGNVSSTKSKTNLRSKLDKVQYNTAKKMKMEIENIISQRKKSSIGIFKI